jgi:hypothetical protein
MLLFVVSVRFYNFFLFKILIIQCSTNISCLRHFSSSFLCVFYQYFMPTAFNLAYFNPWFDNLVSMVSEIIGEMSPCGRDDGFGGARGCIVITRSGRCLTASFRWVFFFGYHYSVRCLPAVEMTVGEGKGLPRHYAKRVITYCFFSLRFFSLVTIIWWDFSLRSKWRLGGWGHLSLRRGHWLYL